MYDKRIKIFIIVSAIFLLVCLLRLTQMQLLRKGTIGLDIAELKKGQTSQLKTVRGQILDKNGRVLATDELRFQLCINYKLSRFLDQRVRKAELLKAVRESSKNPSRADSSATSTNRAPAPVFRQEDAGEDVQQIIDKCSHFALDRKDIELNITEINDKIWDLREYLAWKRNFPDSNFTEAVSDPNERLLLIDRVDIAEMHKSWPILELNTDNDIFTAQLEFKDTDGIEILPMSHRFYPDGSTAAQAIGWVGPATQQQDIKLFENDRLASYLEGEVCGREDGVEYVCENILRGRRGEKVFDIDHKLISRTETEFGKDVTLTLDIELQHRIENYLSNYPHDPNCGPGMAAVVIDVVTGDILALVSLPVFDLNRARFDYSTLANDPNKPLINRAINKQYPPGSVVKPLILIAGLESSKITPDEVISCPAKKAPTGWPSCWLFNKFPWLGHSDQWTNNARNAIKGSCNIYFSRLADRIEPEVLQQWLFKFGYGHQIHLASESDTSSIEHREFRQAQGIISSTNPQSTITSFEQVPPLERGERRYFGIGQGNLRVTPLQVANAMAAIARGGVYKPPRLFLAPDDRSDEIDLDISEETLKVIYDGMSAVVNEPGGTAYSGFAHSGLTEQGVKVYGKTGSTEKPDNAWFAGFAEDGSGRKLSIAVVVEGGQRGSADAAPLARDIIQFCIEAGYIGKPRIKTE